MTFNQLVYLGYYLKTLNIKKLNKFLQHASTKTNKSKLLLLIYAIKSVFSYNISILEYFQFRFYEKDKKERLKWAGTGFMFEYQKKMNPKKVRVVLENKISFNNHFINFIKRNFTTLEILKKDPKIAQILIGNPTGRIVLKNSLSQAGRQIHIMDSKNLTSCQLLNIMSSQGFDLVEDFIVQHPVMMKLSSSGLNTIRLITQVVNGKIEIIAARLRITINSYIDNMAAGNAAAPVDIVTGKVVGSAVFSDITKPDISIHPVTGVKITGFQLPFWKEIIEMVKKAASMIPENKSIGWDVAVTKEGPLLVEGNHNWCKLLWQLPVKRGLKKDLEKYI